MVERPPKIKRGPGRPKGSSPRLTKATLAIAKKVEAKKKGNVLPLEYMLDRMNDVNAPRVERNYMAVSAAPYCHQKQTSLSVTSQGTINVNVNGREMSLDEAQSSFRQIMTMTPQQLLEAQNNPKLIEGEAIRLAAEALEEDEDENA